MLRVLFYASATTSGSEAQSEEISWEDLKALLSVPEVVTNKLYATQMFPGEMLPGTSRKADSCVDRLNLLCLDLDGISEEKFEELRQILTDENLEAVLYTTYSHKQQYEEDGTFRLRLLLPFSRPVLRGEYRLVWANARALFGRCADASAAHPSKHFLMPSHPPGAEDAHIFEEFSGKYLDPDELVSRYDLETLAVFKADYEGGSQPIPPRLIHKAMSGVRRPDHKELVVSMQAAILGEQYAEEGARETTLFKIAWFLAQKFPKGKPEDLGEPFKESIEEEESHGGPSYDDFLDKIRREQHFELQKAAQKVLSSEKKQAQLARLRQQAEPYSKESLQGYLERIPGGSFTSLKQQLIIQKGTSYFVFNGDGYRQATQPDALQVIMESLQFRAEQHLGFDLFYPAEGDKPPKRKPLPQLVMDHGRAADHVEYNYEGLSYFDPRTRTMHLSCVSSPEELEPDFIPEVDEWINVLVSEDADQKERFETWLAACPDTRRALAAIVLYGHKGTGKTAFAKAMSQLFGKQRPVSMQAALDSINGQVLQCPVLLADEKLPELMGRVPTDRIRSFISEGVHEVNQKFMPIVHIRGFYRCVITLNSLDNFKFGRFSHSKEDMEAIGDRFLFVHCNKAAVDKFDGKKFIDEQALARHALWLAVNREPLNLRFGVETNSYQHIIGGDAVASAVLTWIYECLRNRAQLAAQAPKLLAEVPVFVNKGEIYANVDLIRRRWDDYAQKDLKFGVTSKALVSAVKSLSTDEDSERVHLASGRFRYWRVNSQFFKQHVLSNELDTAENVEALLKIPHEMNFRGGEMHVSSMEKRIRLQALRQILPQQSFEKLETKTPAEEKKA